MSNTLSGSPLNYALANLLAPSSGVTHALRLAMTLSAGTLSVAMNSLVQLVGSDFLPQAMTVDNSASAASVTVSETTYGWTRIIGPGSVRTFQFPAVPGAILNFTSSGSAAPIVSLYDWPAFPDSDETPGSSGGSSVTITGPLPLPVSITSTARNYQSAVTVGGANEIVTAGTDVVVFPGGTIPNKGTIYNPSGAPGTLYVDPVFAAQTASPGTNGTTVEIQPGGAWIFDNAAGNVTANSLSNGHSFAAFVE